MKRKLLNLIYELDKTSNSISTIVNSHLLKPVKEKILRPHGHEMLFEDIVKFENVEFTFIAPFRQLEKAKKTGIEARITRLAMSQLRPGAVAIDVGANYGFITLIMGKSVCPNGKVISYEPVSDIYDALSNSIKKNSLTDVCLLVQKPVGKIDDDQFVTLDSEIDRLGISKLDFLKIDVDGTDYDVLLGAKESLRKFRPPLVIEMHMNEELIVELLRSLGYGYMIGMENEVLVMPNFPPNLIASTAPIKIPARGFLAD